MNRSAVYLILFLSAMVACKKEDTPEPLALISKTINNLAADPGTGIDPQNGQPIGTTNKFTLFSFATGTTVPNSDSATNKWDLGFKGTTIIANSGISGPGNAGIILTTGILEDIAEAPESGYVSDNSTSLAIPAGSGKGWYTYDGQAMVIRPTAGKILLVRTAEGKYAKMEIISYYKDAPANPTFMIPARYFTFRYFYQSDGSRILK